MSDKIIPSEDKEQECLVNWLKLNKYDFFSVPNGAYLAGNEQQRFIQMNKLKRTGLVSGASDVVVFLPERILFIEMKKKNKGVLSKEQKKFLGTVNEYHYAVGVVAHGWEEARNLIEYYRMLG